MFSYEIDFFEIQLDNPTATYTPGDTISGKLVLVLISRRSLRALKLRFKGKCEVSWSQRNGRNTDYYDGKETYFRTDLCLVGDADGETIQMGPGHYVYPFSYELPRNIPGSYEHKIGHIRYSIEGIFDRAWKIDDRVKKIITVKSPLEWEPLEQNIQNGIDAEIVESFCCFLLPCVSLGGMLMRIQVPNTICKCGDLIEATINIDNKSRIDVIEVTFKLEEVLDFHSTSPKKKKRKIRTVKEVAEFGLFSKNAEVKRVLEAPQLSTVHLKYCNIIDLNYRLKISVHYSGCNPACERTYNIFIGLRSPTPAISYEELPSSPTTNCSTPRALEVPIDSHETEFSPRIPVGYINPPYPPSVFPGPYLPECNESSDIRFIRRYQPSDQDNWDGDSLPSYDVAVARYQRTFDS